MITWEIRTNVDKTGYRSGRNGTLKSDGDEEQRYRDVCTATGKGQS